MTKPRRQFEFGPYKTPRFRYGAVVQCELRGEVVIVGLSKGRIPWPIGRRRGDRFNVYVVYRDLAKALRCESSRAVQYWFGLSHGTVTRFRQALGVSRTTEGTHLAMSRHGKTAKSLAQLKKGWAKARDPERCAKIAAAHRGRPRPKHLVEAWRRARYASGPRRSGRPWSKREDELALSGLTAKQVGKRIGRTEDAPAVQRICRTLILAEFVKLPI